MNKLMSYKEYCRNLKIKESNLNNLGYYLKTLRKLMELEERRGK